MARLVKAPRLDRAGRRQVRKLLGRALGAEWRVFGNRRGATRYDHHHQMVAKRVAALGHVADKLRANAVQEQA